MSPPVPGVPLNNDVQMPSVGFGVFQVPDDETEHAVLTAIESGYRSIDTAALYGNEAGVGRAIAGCGVRRGELFVTTKLWNDDQGYDSAFRAYEASLQRLDLDYVDLYLIHWPKPSRDRYIETWRAFEKLYTDQRVRGIGVSNFQPHHLQRLLDETHVVPAVNQIELHPQLQQPRLRHFHAAHGILTEAWSPLGQGTLFDDLDLKQLANKYGKTVAQVAIRWHLDRGFVVIPKSVRRNRIEENFGVFDFELDKEDIAKIASLDSRDGRIGPNPDTADF